MAQIHTGVRWAGRRLGAGPGSRGLTAVCKGAGPAACDGWLK